MLLPAARSGSIQESEVASLNRRNAARGRREVNPIYTQPTRLLARSVSPGRIRELVRGHAGRSRALLEAGHLLGSASIEIEFAGEGTYGKALRLLASGDLGPDAKLLQPDPEAPVGLDYVISESTYGASDRAPITAETRRQHIGDVVRAARAARRSAVDSGFCGGTNTGTYRRSHELDESGQGPGRADLSRFAAGHPCDGGFPPECREHSIPI